MEELILKLFINNPSSPITLILIALGMTLTYYKMKRTIEAQLLQTLSTHIEKQSTTIKILTKRVEECYEDLNNCIERQKKRDKDEKNSVGHDSTDPKVDG